MPQAADLLRPSRRRTRPELLGGGTASIPVREKGQERRFAAGTSLSQVPGHRRPPPKCGAFRRQPRGSLLRQTCRWREQDSNPRSPVRETTLTRLPRLTATTFPFGAKGDPFARGTDGSDLLPPPASLLRTYLPPPVPRHSR